MKFFEGLLAFLGGAAVTIASVLIAVNVSESAKGLIVKCLGA